MNRKLDESMTLKPETPKTLASESTTAIISFALPIIPVISSANLSIEKGK